MMIIDKLPFFTSFLKNDDHRYRSWYRYSNKVYNIQNKFSPVKVENTEGVFLKTVTQFGKTTHSIHDIIKLAKKISKKFVLINSDIELSINDELWAKIMLAADNGIVMGHRFNYAENYDNSTINSYGVDFYVLNNKISIPDDNNFCIGLCGWDWWIPYLSIQQNIPIYRISCPFFYHKIHPKQWTKESYDYICNYMLKITNEIHDIRFKQKIIAQTIGIC